MNRVEVEVVRRFVQQQGSRMSEERLRKQHTHLLSAPNSPHLALAVRLECRDPCREDGGVALGAVAVSSPTMPSSSPSRMPSSSVMSAPFSMQALALVERIHRRLLPMMTVSTTRYWSKAN